jgi:addiction module HigA family antidote
MMKNPAHPGSILKDQFEALDPPKSVAEAAEALGVTRQQLYRVISGESAISSEMALRLELANIGNADLWLRMQYNFDLAQTRLRAGSLRVKPLAPKVA